jgi:hypothetical protein
MAVRKAGTLVRWPVSCNGVLGSNPCKRPEAFRAEVTRRAPSRDVTQSTTERCCSRAPGKPQKVRGAGAVRRTKTRYRDNGSANSPNRERPPVFKDVARDAEPGA